MKKLLILITLSIIFCTYGQVGINTSSPTSTLDVNGTARVRSLVNGTTFTQNIVADDSGNLGFTTRVALPPNYSQTVAVSAPPVTVCTGCSLSQIAPILTVLLSTSNPSPPSYNFGQSGSNITLDFQSAANDSTPVTFTVTFVRR